MERELKISTAPTRLSALWENSLTNWTTLTQLIQEEKDEVLLRHRNRC